ncbi:L,D-transpeptidase family protein [Streptomyces sp. BI20]|uniref:L,D-transpeptidase family protein n=1 Tax=Streptomyces sp. BI20 TaxID=3403460 RepID=UPI003C7817D0
MQTFRKPGPARAARASLGVAGALALALAVTACGPQPADPAARLPKPAASSDDGKGGGGPSASTDPSAGPSSAAPSASGSSAGSPSASAAPSGEPSAPVKSSVPAPPGGWLMTDGTENEQVRELQARLRQAGYLKRSPTAFYGSLTTAAVRAFQAAQGLPTTGSVDRATWEKLLATTRQPTAGELRPATANEPAAPDPRCMTGRVMCISKESRTLVWMIDGKAVSSMDVRFGSENTPTREGVFKVDRKEREWESTIYHTPMPWAMFFSGGQAVHYSADFAARGYAGASHGCVNVRDKAAVSALFDQVRAGDKVVVYW